MVKPLISEILTTANKMKGGRAKKIAYLQEQDCTALRDIIRIAFDNSITLALPEGAPPFKKFEIDEATKYRPQELRFEYPTFRYFIAAVTPTLNQFKREQIFIDLLERIHSEDAQLFCDAKDKNINLKYITKALLKEAFPGLIKS